MICVNKLSQNSSHYHRLMVSKLGDIRGYFFINYIALIITYQQSMQKPIEITQEQTISTPKSQKRKFYISSNRQKKQIRCTSANHGYRNIWSMSASTMTRDVSPAHKIPRARRFIDLSEERAKNSTFLSFNLREEMNKGVTFAKSKRKDNFVDQNKKHEPSSATYFKNSYEIDPISDMNNPQLEEKLNLISQQLKSFRSTTSSKGVTFNKFKNYHTLYLHHGRKQNFQPQTTRHNPGVGHYTVSPDRTRLTNPSFTFRKILTRFNQNNNQSPGPGAYRTVTVNPHINESINQKGTFENSNRIFLKNPHNGTPGPGAYLFDD